MGVSNSRRDTETATALVSRSSYEDVAVSSRARRGGRNSFHLLRLALDGRRVSSVSEIDTEHMATGKQSQLHDFLGGHFPGRHRDPDGLSSRPANGWRIRGRIARS